MIQQTSVMSLGIWDIGVRNFQDGSYTFVMSLPLGWWLIQVILNIKDFLEIASFIYRKLFGTDEKPVVVTEVIETVADATEVIEEKTTIENDAQTDIKLFQDLLVDPEPIPHGLIDARNTHPQRFAHLVERFWHKTVPDLKQWLMQRNVTRNLSSLRKAELIELHYAYDVLKSHMSQGQPLKCQDNYLIPKSQQTVVRTVTNPPPAAGANIGQLMTWLTQERSAAERYGLYQTRTLGELRENCRSRGLLVDDTMWKEEVVAILLAHDVNARYQTPPSRNLSDQERSRIAQMIGVPSTDGQKRYASMLACKRGCEPLTSAINEDKYLVAEWIDRNKHLMSRYAECEDLSR